MLKKTKQKTSSRNCPKRDLCVTECLRPRGFVQPCGPAHWLTALRRAAAPGAKWETTFVPSKDRKLRRVCRNPKLGCPFPASPSGSSFCFLLVVPWGDFGTSTHREAVARWCSRMTASNPGGRRRTCILGAGPGSAARGWGLGGPRVAPGDWPAAPPGRVA